MKMNRKVAAIIASAAAIAGLSMGLGACGSSGHPSPSSVTSQMVGTKANDGSTVTAATYVAGTEHTWKSGAETFEADVTYSDGAQWRDLIQVAADGSSWSASVEYQESP